MDTDLLGKIITGVITAIVTLVVCLVNNYFQSKRDDRNRDENTKKQINEIQSLYMSKINEVKEDYTGQVSLLSDDVKEIKHTITDLAKDMAHNFTLVNKEIQTLSERQTAYNNLQSRTYNLEKDLALNTECIKVANHRIEDLERDLDKK